MTFELFLCAGCDDEIGHLRRIASASCQRAWLSHSAHHRSANYCTSTNTIRLAGRLDNPWGHTAIPDCLRLEPRGQNRAWASAAAPYVATHPAIRPVSQHRRRRRRRSASDQRCGSNVIFRRRAGEAQRPVLAVKFVKNVIPMRADPILVETADHKGSSIRKGESLCCIINYKTQVIFAPGRRVSGRRTNDDDPCR